MHLPPQIVETIHPRERLVLVFIFIFHCGLTFWRGQLATPVLRSSCRLSVCGFLASASRDDEAACSLSRPRWHPSCFNDADGGTVEIQLHEPNEKETHYNGTRW